MPKSKKKEAEFCSYEEYVRHFLPDSAQELEPRYGEPRKIGITIAKEALKKIKDMVDDEKNEDKK